MEKACCRKYLLKTLFLIQVFVLHFSEIYSQEAPIFAEKTAQETGVEGKSITLVCNVSKGNPIPRYSWRKIDDISGQVQSIPIGIEQIERNNQSVLLIPNFESSFYGKYICEARNKFGNDTKTYKIVPADRTGPVIGGIAATIFVVTLLMVWICMEFFRKSKNGLTKEEIQRFRYGNPEAIQKSGDLTTENIDNLPYRHEVFEIRKEEMSIDKERILGEGQYGRVYLGKHNQRNVAIKTVKPGVEKSYLKALLSELKIMTYIGAHPNVVCTLGACSQELRNGELYIVLELCDLGSLEKYIRKCKTFSNLFDPHGALLSDERSGLYENKVNDSSMSTYSNMEADLELNTLDLLHWSLQIARGMEHLASKKTIHGDLAARNILLTDRYTAKITDFGLSRKLYDYSNYVKKNQEPLPWRWMAIESLRELSFSCQSDVWGYGVTIWEIFTLGELPYPGLSWDNNFINSLENNFRLSKPKYASDHIYWNLMLECWRISPSERPTFSTIVNYLECVLRLNL